MIRRVTLSALTFVFMYFPLGATAQTGDSNRVTIESDATAGGCVAGATTDDTQGHGFDLTNLDRSVNPCDDFFKFAGGGWVKSHPIPAAYPRWGTFDQLRDNNEEVQIGRAHV